MIKEQFNQVVTRVNALQLRERLLLLVCSIVFIYFLADSVGFQPVLEEQQVLLDEIKSKEHQFEILLARSYQLDGEVNDDPAVALDELRLEFNSVVHRLQAKLENMLSPDKAADILEQVMAYEDGLRLEEISTRQVSMVSDGVERVGEGLYSDIKRYELQLQLEGGYLQTLRYLRALEALPWKFFWTDVDFSITDHPVARVDLEVYTLGLSGI